ncbi:hypothetical protein LOK49_LG13G01384 [Camellia lanceoleosa]|uniref:Uncharacterized protein n=1 Tax=Camellia lanceoleosa TaxID=1840588 RepID=A0ACC0FGQ9_9ERIC|nr:hypothetical protein LOK49_LG13G01384 [Camellia lanceoleosa]
MATLLLFTLATSTITTGNLKLSIAIDVPKSSFLHGIKLHFAPSAANSKASSTQRCCFRSPRSSKPLDHVLKRFREENLKKGSLAA